MTETTIKTPQEIVQDMIRGIAVLADKMDGLSRRMEKLERALVDDVLSTRLEDLTKAMDDHRSSLAELAEVTDGTGGALTAILSLIEDAGSIARENNSKVTWEDLGKLLKKYREEAEDDDEDEEDEDDLLESK